MNTPTGRLGPAPDMQSAAVLADKTNGTAPVVVLMFGASGTGAGPTPHSTEGADMAQSTRGPDPSDRQTRNSGVNITPLTRSGPVTSISPIA